MSKAPESKIFRYSWNHGKRDEIKGVLLRSDSMRIFVAPEQLRTFADYLHDSADHYEQQENNA